jgi:hypothetical protein
MVTKSQITQNDSFGEQKMLENFCEFCKML